jgi:nucleotide-binding universal stress UspA family protein
MATAQLTATGVSIRNVLITTDFSRQSSEIMRAGMDLCSVYGAHPYILYVLPRDEFMLAGFEAYAAARDAARRDLLEIERELSAKYDGVEGRDYDLLMTEGDVSECILDCARERNIDLIVVGTHGRSGLSKALLGSVAERIFRHSDIPVLTIGPYAHPRTAFDARRILVPVDFTPASRNSAQYACRLAQEHHSNLTMIHVMQDPQRESLADVECLKRGVEQSLAELVHGDVDAGRLKVRAELGAVVPRVLHAAVDENADLMILGVHNYPGLLNRLRWQVAYDLVRQSPCPVLTVRERCNPKKSGN